ncbi:peptidoglycan recognition protein family protein [Bacillus wiedmannii]|uniref:peptidoglycan recognition protein family protein n=1 Tax=Bacillus wiedmannii TaxID=1890302 RepID=UPI0011556EC3|nr:N-acetylmuramoyl-L-alanine amidase [Bacillus wiedmannii]
MEIRKNLVASSKYGTKCPYTMNPEFITVHNTYNDATAENEVAYMISNDNQVSFHIAVDDKEAVQGIPLERNAWHCGDGNGNRKSIGVEICYSLSGGNRYYKAEDNAAIVVTQLIKQYNIPISKVRTHQSWSGKYCPHRMLAEGRWNSFIEKVQNAYNGGGKDNSNVQANEPPFAPTEWRQGRLRCNVNVNLRSRPVIADNVIQVLPAGSEHTFFAIVPEKNGVHWWYDIGGGRFVREDNVKEV